MGRAEICRESWAVVLTLLLVYWVAWANQLSLSVTLASFVKWDHEILQNKEFSKLLAHLGASSEVFVP